MSDHSQHHVDGPIHVAAAKSPVGKASTFSPLHSMQQQNFVTPIAALNMSCAAFGSSLTSTVGVKMFFEYQKHADAGESKHDATARLADVAVGHVDTAKSARMHANFGRVAPARPRSGWEILINTIMACMAHG